MVDAQAKSEAQVLIELELVLEIRRPGEGMHIAVRRVASLAEGADIAQEHVRHRGINAA